MILGESGSGKSYLLKRIAYEFFKEGWDVFLPVAGKNINEAFDQLLESEKPLLIIDDAYNRVNEINEILNKNATLREKIVILFAERREKWFMTGKDPIGEMELRYKNCLVKYLFLTEEDVKKYFIRKKLKSSKINKNIQGFMQEYAGKPGEFLMLLLFYGTSGGKDLIQWKIESIKKSIDYREEELLRKIFTITSFEGKYPLNVLLKQYKNTGIINKIISLKNKGLISGESFIETYHPYICKSFLEVELKENKFLKRSIIDNLEIYLKNIDIKVEYIDMLNKIAINIGLGYNEELLPIAIKYFDKILDIDDIDENSKVIALHNKALAFEFSPKGIRYQNEDYIKKAINSQDTETCIGPA